MKSQKPIRDLIQKLHRNERGAITLETVLIIAAVAIPILIFILKWGWPKIRSFFNEGMDNLQEEAENTSGES